MRSLVAALTPPACAAAALFALAAAPAFADGAHPESQLQQLLPAPAPEEIREASRGTAPPACSFPSWVPGKHYPPLAIVTYQSRPHFAKYENPGYLPSVSTYFWGAYACPVVDAASGCTSADWMRDWPYKAGEVVRFEGAHYIARHDNPGYVPTISTYFWAPHRCTGGTGLPSAAAGTPARPDAVPPRRSDEANAAGR